MAVERVALITAIAPQFLVDDVDRAIAYYRDKLGFSVDFTYQSFYASVSRDGFAIRLKHAPKVTADRAHRKENEHLDAYFAVSGWPAAPVATNFHEPVRLSTPALLLVGEWDPVTSPRLAPAAADHRNRTCRRRLSLSLANCGSIEC